MQDPKKLETKKSQSTGLESVRRREQNRKSSKSSKTRNKEKSLLIER